MSLRMPGLTGVLLIALLVFSRAAAAQVPPRKTPTRPVSKAPATGAEANVKYKGVWEPAHVGQDIKLNDVFFVTPEVGWVAGDKGSIFHTKDGGKTWAAQIGGDPEATGAPVRNLRFLDESQGWAVLGDGKLLRTADGESWEEFGKVGEYFGFYYDYTFLSPSEAVQIIKEGNIIFRTQDGGKKWTQVNPTCKFKVEAGGLPVNAGCRLTNFFFTSPQNGFAAGATWAPSVFILLKTTDGGNSWSPLTSVPDVAHADEAHFEQYLAFTDENNGIAVLPRGPKVLLTSDGGVTWRGVISQVKGPVKFADPEVGWSFDIGYGHTRPSFSFTTNGGKTWTTRQMTLPGPVNAFSLPRRDRGYIAGDHGMVYRYRMVPESEPSPANSIAAPVMPGFDSPLDDQAVQLQQQLQSLEQAIEKKTGQQIEITPVTEASDAAAAAAPPESEGAATGPGMAEQVAPQQLEAIASTVENLNAEVPKFTGKFRNLNMVFQGLQMVGQLFGQAQGLKDSLGQLKKAKDVASISAALSQLTGQTQGLVQSAKSAFQAPQQ